jgi:hypothetical protein
LLRVIARRFFLRRGNLLKIRKYTERCGFWKALRLPR